MNVFKKVISLALLVVFALFCFVFVFPALPRNVTPERTVATPVILTLWHVESFEGGVGSRADWLKRRAIEFEKNNQGIFVDVVKLTPEQLSQKLSEGQCFDLVSFGFGVGELVANRIAEISATTPVFDNLLSAGQMDGKQYAIPYLSGGYLLAGKSADLQKIQNYVDLKNSVFDCSIQKTVGKKEKKLYSVLLGYSKYCSPMTSLATLADKAQNFSVIFAEKTLTQYGAYEKFLQGDVATVLLGSQRDYWRLSNRQKNGKIGEIVYSVVGNYTDLTQYVAIAQSGEREKMKLSNDFANFLLIKSVQAKASDVGMLSVWLDDIYDDGVMAQLQTGLKEVSLPNVFATQSVIRQMYEESVQVIKTGEKNLLKKYIRLY